MWIDASGTLHTVALPTPVELMSTEFRTGLDDLLRSDVRGVRDVVDDELDRFYDGDYSTIVSAHEAIFEAMTPPQNLLMPRVDTAQHVANVLREIDWRWRLDAILALDDYIDQQDGSRQDEK